MKNILVVSDTHNNIDLLEMIINMQKEIPDIIIHLGDFYDDIFMVKNLPENTKIYRVPGTFHPGFKNNTLDIVKVVKIANTEFMFAHRFQDLVSLANKIGFKKINLFGHTHKPEFFIRDGNLFINPGHLNDWYDRGQNASFANIKLAENKISIKIIDYENKLIKEYTEDLNVNRRN